jgi:flagellar hook-basal body complex protein FliE
MKVACLDPKLSQFIHSVPISIARCAAKEAKKTSENVLGTTNSKFTQFAELTTGCNVDLQEKNAKQCVNQATRSQIIAQNVTLDVSTTQEIGIAFTLLLEMRHKLTDGFKELMRLSM